MFYVLFWGDIGVTILNILRLELDLKLPKVVNPVQVFLFFPFWLLCLKVQKDAVEKKLKPAQLVSQSHTIGPVNEASRTASTLPCCVFNCISGFCLNAASCLASAGTSSTAIYVSQQLRQLYTNQ